MRITPVVLALVLVALEAPAALACRVAPDPIFVPVWQHPPTPDQLRPTDTALEVELVGHVLSSGSSDPEIIILACQPFQDLFRIVRVIAGDTRATHIITPGTIGLVQIVVPDKAGNAAPSKSGTFFVVGHFTSQRTYFLSRNGENSGIPMLKPGSDVVDPAVPVFIPREPG